MNDIRRTILWVIFGFSMVLLWDKWQVHNGHKATFFPGATPAAVTPVSQSPAASGAAGASPVPAPTAAAAPANAQQVPGGVPQTAPAAARQRVTLTTDVLRLTFDSEGGS